jgi:hypothetical protein
MQQQQHLAACPTWLRGWGEPQPRCQCPPPWRIRKNQTAGVRYPWRIQRRLQDGTYELFMSAISYDKAVAMVSSITQLTHRPTS